MNTLLSSRLFLLGLSINASILLTTMVSPGAFAQAQGDQFTSTADNWYGPIGDVFSSSSSDLSSYPSSYPPSISFFYGQKNGENDAFDDNEKIDPGAFTWTYDPRDPFASRPSDNLDEFPVYKGSTRSLSFISVSDGPQITPEIKKSFAAPKAFKPPKWTYWHEIGSPDSFPISGDSYTDKFGHSTQLFGWSVNRRPVRVYFAGDVGDVRDGLVKRVFIDCMKQWCGATRGLLKFTVTDDSRSADIILCREFTSNHELAENNPTFHNGWLDRVKIRLIDSTCDSLGEAQLRAVLLHSAGHSLGYFRHTGDKNSAMNENCAHAFNPTQSICPCDKKYIREMYVSYKNSYDLRFKKEVDIVTKVPWGHPFPWKPMPARGIEKPPVCPTKITKIAKPAVPTGLNAQRQRLTIKPLAIKPPST